MGKGGRPPKTVQLDSLPSLAERGVRDRRTAKRALDVAKIPDDIWNAYKAATDRPTEFGLLNFVRERAENYSESETGNGRGHPWWFPSARGKKYLALHATRASTEYYSPPEFLQALGCRFHIDVASPGAHITHWIPADRHFTPDDDGLAQDWADAFVFMNHPYARGSSPQWTEKFRKHSNGVAVVVDRTSVAWWQALCGGADLILFVNKKIQYLRPNDAKPGNNALGSTVVGYGEKAVQALKNAERAGLGTAFVPLKKVTERVAELETENAELRAKLAEIETPRIIQLKR
jgi:hypothetical protein